jgi:hypothetical protein
MEFDTFKGDKSVLLAWIAANQGLAMELRRDGTEMLLVNGLMQCYGQHDELVKLVVPEVPPDKVTFLKI